MNPLRIRQQFHRLAKSRLALSTVVTTLIVLVVAVLLAGVVTYFAINVTSTRVQEESLALAKQHVWFDYSTGKAQAAIMVINAGGRDVVVDKITVRGQVCDWSKVFYNLTGESISGDLASSSTLTDGGTISVGGSNHIFKQATNDLTVQSGKTIIIYISTPDSISVNDVGLTVSVNIFTSQAMYYKETNVQGTGGTTTVSLPSTFTLFGTSAYYYPTWPTQPLNEVGMVLYNGGNTEVTVSASDLKINGTHPSVGITIAGWVGTLSNPPSSLPFWSDELQEVYGKPIRFPPADLTIKPGESAYVYFGYLNAGSFFKSGDTIIASLDSGSGVSQTVTVDNYPPI
jgi:hypothetical protein